jgi:hypothetical protein
MSPDLRLEISACVGRLIDGAPVASGFAQLKAEITWAVDVEVAGRLCVAANNGPGLSSALKY